MKKFTIGLLALVASANLYAADRYEFDKVHSQILFFVSHLGFTNSMGEFLDYEGEVRFDPDQLANSSVNVSIKTASLDMGDARWNKHMHSDDLFDVEKYPTMDFKSTRVIPTGDNTMIVNGQLTLLGQTKPVGLAVTLNKAGVHPFSKKTVAGFTAFATLNRSEWGMNYGLPAIGDQVEIRLEAELNKVD